MNQTRVRVVKDPVGYVRLNVLDSWDDDFKKVACDKTTESRRVCDEYAYVSRDPRLVSSAHSGQRLALDNIPLNGKVQISDTPYIAGYPNVYDTYSDIHGGQVEYYYDKQLASPFISQLFVNPGLVTRERYVDPMDSVKPHYCRVSLDNKNCLSWIRDSQFHREDLMSKQIWKRNQTDFAVQREASKVY